ncbi:MAG: hypothetical protein M1155_01385 [Patescibacteria group bacterium]|nr:hypothetical protein [Patescibacteria group bacterium]
MESDDRGRRAEEVVGQVLAIMEKEGLIAGSYRNKQHGEVDELGIDFLVYMRNGLILPVQVKAASKDNENRRCKHLKKHPYVPFMIFVNLELHKVRPEKVMNDVLEELRGFLRTR